MPFQALTKRKNSHPKGIRLQTYILVTMYIKQVKTKERIVKKYECEIFFMIKRYFTYKEHYHQHHQRIAALKTKIK